MSHTPHEITEEFPEHRERITELRTTNGRFARLLDEYHDTNQAVHRVETRVEPASEDVEEELKRKRVRLKDEIALMLSGESTAGDEALGRDPERVNSPPLRGGF